MKESFENTIHAYNDAIRAEGGVSTPEKHMLIKKAARTLRTKPETQEKIFNYQQQKAALMQELHAAFAKVDRDEPVERDTEDAVMVYGNPDGTYEAIMHNHPVPLTKGELYTDGEWGMSYALDPQTTSHAVRKRYLIEDTKRSLRTLFNTQLLTNEAGKISRMPGGNRFFKKMLEGEIHEGSGNIAEKMVRTFLARVSIDHDVDFTIEAADVIQDTKDKVDFIIHRKSHDRGVRVAEEERADVGIQFTTDTREETIKHKHDQMNAVRDRVRQKGYVDDTVLVAIPLSMTRALYEKWQANPTPGGPASLWVAQIKEQVLRGVLADIVPQDEIERTVGCVVGE